MARLRDKEKAAIVIEARRLDMTDGREPALAYLAEHGMGGWEGNGYASAHRILDYQTFRYVDCVPREHPLWREWRSEEDAAIARRLEARKLKPALMERSGGKCEWCGRNVEGKNATVDHIDPDLGNDMTNLALLCRSCNARKSNGTLKRVEGIDEARQRRQQRNETEAIELGFSSYEAMQRAFHCPCTHHGCPPYCSGCEMCGHTGRRPPRKNIICPNWIDSLYDGETAGCADIRKCAEAGECKWEKLTEGAM